MQGRHRYAAGPFAEQLGEAVAYVEINIRRLRYAHFRALAMFIRLWRPGGWLQERWLGERWLGERWLQECHRRVPHTIRPAPND